MVYDLIDFDQYCDPTKGTKMLIALMVLICIKLDIPLRDIMDELSLKGASD